MTEKSGYWTEETKREFLRELQPHFEMLEILWRRCVEFAENCIGDAPSEDPADVSVRQGAVFSVALSIFDIISRDLINLKAQEGGKSGRS